MYLIFDFDGTLVDSFSCAMEKFNSLAKDFNFRKLTAEEIEALRNLSSRDIIKYLKIPIYKIPAVIYKARKCLQNEMHKLIPVKGIPEVLHDLSKAGFSMGIVTSNSEENVIAWLNHHGIKQYFDFIYIESSFFGKKRVLQKILKINKIKNAIYIGDETRDIEAAKQCKISSIAVTWGFNSEKILAKYHPHHIAHTPQELLSIGLQYLRT